ncbi:MAG TPA: mechanosensitive ion channel domain-containing protein [Polyangiaceae bacterium]|jgi:small-conductance mechanosensitive channel
MAWSAGPFDRFEAALEAWLGLSPTVTDGLIATTVSLVVYLTVERLSRRVVARLVSDTSVRFQINKAVGYLLGVLAFLVILKIWVHEVTGLATYFGLLSAGLAIALQDPVANFAGWIYIIIRRPFGVGDRIQIGQNMGDVVDIRPFRFVMMEVGNWVKAEQSTGRVIHVPNAFVFKNPVANYDEAFGYIWNELEVVVSMESDWKAAKAELLRIANEHAEKLTADVTQRIRLAADSLHIRFGKTSPVVWTSVVDSGVRLTVRYLCKPRERRSSASEFWEAILESFANMPKVDLAYPTTRFYDNRTEGKVPGATPEPGAGQTGATSLREES